MYMTILGTPMVVRLFCYFNPKRQVSFEFGWALLIPGVLHYMDCRGWDYCSILREIHGEHTGRFVAIEWTPKMWEWARSLR